MFILDFPDITVTASQTALILHSTTPLQTLSSAVVGGGFSQAYAIINRYVDKDYDNRDPQADLHTFATLSGVSQPFIGLLTAVPMRKARAVTQYNADITISVITTAGIGNATAAGRSKPFTSGPGTINTVVLIDGNPEPGAMVNIIKVVAEAQTAVLLERDIRTSEGYPATGTSTDCIVIASTGHGEALPYAGPITTPGYMIANCVRLCLEAALDAE